MSQSLAQKFKLHIPTEMEFSDSIVVVEDQQDLRLILVHHLHKTGYSKVFHANNGFDAFEAVKKAGKSPIILCDMMMPGLGGLDFLGELQEKPELPRGPFCLMMDSASKEKVMLAFEVGVDEVITKPFTMADILPKLKAAFKKFHNPANPEKVYELAKSYWRDGHLNEAAHLYKELADSAQKAARPWVGLARVALKTGDTKEALRYLTEAESHNANYVHLFAVRGSVYASMNDWNNAIANYTHAIKLSPLNPVRYHDAVEMLFKVNRYQEAVDLLYLAEGHQLDFPNIHHFASQGLFALHDFKGATKYIRRALHADPENVVYLNQLGICLKEAEDFDEAQKTYNKVIKLDPDNLSALYNKAVMFHAKGDMAEAIKLLERLVKKHSGFAQGKTKLEEYRQESKSKKTA